MVYLNINCTYMALVNVRYRMILGKRPSLNFLNAIKQVIIKTYPIKESEAQITTKIPDIIIINNNIIIWTK